MAKTQNTRNKKTTTRKTRRTPKPKVYIPAYKIIIFCAVIITICMALLLATSIMSKPKQTSISERYEEDVKVETNVVVKEPEVKVTEPKKVKEPKTTVKVTPSKKQEETKSVKKEEVKKPVVEEKTKTPVIEKKVTPPKKEEAKPVVKEEKKTQPKNDFGFPKAVNNAQLIFVFDDGGHNLKQAEKFLALPFPYTVAVLPRLEFSKETADLFRNNGNEVILHQPMQAINPNVDPGEGAITPTMTNDEIIRTLFQNVTEIGPVAGMNNHEGSAITADAEKMATVLRFTSQEGIYFLDSRTNKDTTVPYVAKELGYSYYERNIFLDNEKTRDNILSELKKGLTIANKKGNVIMIGHIWSADVLPSVLLEVYPELKEKGYTFSTVSKSNAKIN